MTTDTNTASMDLSKIPQLPPPPGVQSNFVNPESRAIDVHIGMGLSIAFTTLFVAARIYAKLSVSRLWGWDDWTCILAWITIIIHDGISFTLLDSIGKHQWDVPVSNLTLGFLQRIFSTGNLYAVAALFVKTSLFVLYMRLFNPNKGTRWAIYIGGGVCVVFYIASIIANCLIYMPLPGQKNDLATWAARAGAGSYRGTSLVVAMGVFGMLSDIYLLVIPIKSVLKLRMRTGRKIGMTIIFSTGIIAVGCSICSLYYRIRSLIYGHTDNTWLGTPVFIFSSAEISAGIVCSCMPICASLTRHPTIKRWGKRVISLTSRLRYSSNRSAGSGSKQSDSTKINSNRHVEKANNTPPRPADAVDRLYPREETTVNSSVWTNDEPYQSTRSYNELESGLSRKGDSESIQRVEPYGKR